MSGTANAEPKHGQMTGFIHAFYGTMMGVSFFKFSTDRTKKLIIDYQTCAAGAFWNSESFHAIVIFLGTFLITAHDWYSYNKYDRTSETNKGRPFVVYLPQIFALLALTQMYVSAEYVYFPNWYLFGCIYVFLNIINSVIGNTGEHGSGEKIANLIYGSIQLIIGIGGYFFVKNNPSPMWVFAVTMLLVFSMWALKDVLIRKVKEIVEARKIDKQKKAVSAFEQFETKLKSAITDAETQLKSIDEKHGQQITAAIKALRKGILEDPNFKTIGKHYKPDEKNEAVAGS